MILHLPIYEPPTEITQRMIILFEGNRFIGRNWVIFPHPRIAFTSQNKDYTPKKTSEMTPKLMVEKRWVNWTTALFLASICHSSGGAWNVRHWPTKIDWIGLIGLQKHESISWVRGLGIGRGFDSHIIYSIIPSNSTGCIERSFQKSTILRNTIHHLNNHHRNIT